MPDVISDASATASATLAITQPWIKVPTDPTLNIAVYTLDRAPITRQEAQSVHWPIGREDAVVVSSARRSVVSSITVWRATIAERNALDAILDARVTCLLQIPSEESGQPGEQWYVRFRSSSEQRVVRVTDAARGVELPFVEVRAP